MSDTGRDPFSQLLYPMLSEQPPVGDPVLAALAQAPLEKMAESNRLRAQLLEESGDDIVDCAQRIAESFRDGGRLFSCGNGGSATTAADLATELLQPTDATRGLPALCLTNDVAVLTAVANDVGFDDVYTRQLIALGRAGDVLVAISTSGNSENLVRALREARARGMATVAVTGYDGGRMVQEESPDFTFTVRSSSVHRIQEVQTTLCHLLIEIVRRFTESDPCA